MYQAFKRSFAGLAMATAVFTVPAFAEAPVATPPAPPAAANAGSPALWTLTKSGGGTITLFGSVHLLPQSQTWRSPAFQQALDKADTVVFETPIDGMMTPEIQTLLQQNMANPPGVTLSTLLTPEQKTTVEKAAMSVGAPFAALEPLRPWMVGLQLSVAFVMKQGLDPNSGVDKIVEAEAKAAGKTLDYFETATEQLTIFTSMGKEEENTFLVLGARDILERPNEMKELLDAWARGDSAIIDKLMNEGLEELPELAKRLIDDRDTKWVEKISSTYMADTKNYLIVVGAAHLAGDKSVIAMLRAKGVTISGP